MNLRKYPMDDQICHLALESCEYTVIPLVWSCWLNIGLLRATSTVCNVLHGWSREQENEQQNNAPGPNWNNAAAGYQSPVKIELLKGTGPL